MIVSLDDKAASSGDEAIRVSAKIIAIDLDTREVTLQFEDGSTQTFPARPDTDLSRLKLGEREDICVTEMTAIWIEKTQ